MKLRPIITALVLSLLAGCTSTNAPTTQQAIAVGSAVTQIGVIGAILNAKDKPATAKRIYNAAVQIKAAAADDANLLDLNQLAAKVIAQQVNGDDRIIAQAVTILVLDNLKTNLGIGLDATALPPSLVKSGRDIITALTDEAMRTADPFRGAM